MSTYLLGRYSVYLLRVLGIGAGLKPLYECGERKRPVVIISLDEITTDFVDELKLVGTLHAFSDDLHIERIGHVYDIGEYDLVIFGDHIIVDK